MVEYMFESRKSAFILQEIHRTKKDLMKFVPFSAFLIIPFSEVLLPPYLYFFPNALPTTYIFDDGYP
jgi:LETM1 and EF-hand domain-containing protein 1